ncbi:MAG: beta-lactamase family protein [Candidatus Aminicenantes bacterium]|nr:beta-lactamase family protein [Candidatus Aminicenantes bacterium]MDH5706082.1 beta-lactamase family protein [Candidatus Aminicenantes bacterium]
MIRKKLMVAVLCLLFFQVLFAQAPGEISYKDESVMPAGKEGERIRALIATVNSNDPAQIRRFVEEALTEEFQKIAPMEEHINVVLDFLRETGGVDFHSIRTYVPERKGDTVVILKDRLFESWRAFVIRFDGSENYLIAGLQFNVARTPSNVKESALSEKQFLQTIKDLLPRLCEKEVFSGSLLIAKGDKVLLEYACGEASKSFHVPNTIETKLNLGSMNKMFTATSIAQLAEKGLLTYQDPISKYVDESWLPKEITSKITIHHLLTHSSGLGSYFNETFMNSSRALYRKLDDYKPLVKDEKPAFEPGLRFSYSNTGMFLLGVVIEKVTGQSYFDYIRENLYKPAGMMNTDCYEMDYPVENLAIGYSPDRKSPYGWQNNLYQHVIKGGPAGGGFSTVRDLHRFALALLGGKLVSADSLKVLWKDYLGANYGYGFRVAEGPNGKVVGHSGGFPGINGNLDIFLDKGYIVAVLSNYDRGASPVADKINQLLARVK